MRRLLTVTVAWLSAALLCVPAQARADNGWGSTTCSHAPSPTCNVVAGNRPDHPAGNSHHSQPDANTGADSSGSDFGCRYVPVDYSAPSTPSSEPGGWYMVLCSPDGKDPDSHGPVWVAAGAKPPAVSPEQVAETARKQLRLPSPSIAASPSGMQLVQLPTWLWLSGGWSESSATASVPGVSVTATARPTSVTWTMGDGAIVTCAGAGTPYKAGTDPKASSPDCGHVYRRSSAGQPGQAYPVTATVHWTVTWSGAGQGGTFPDMTTTGNASFRVAESQALNNAG
jgi:hypothetical protein